MEIWVGVQVSGWTLGFWTTRRSEIGFTTMHCAFGFTRASTEGERIEERAPQSLALRSRDPGNTFTVLLWMTLRQALHTRSHLYSVFGRPALWQTRCFSALPFE